jgi:polysaccharide deacetylase 2 family uncharacterized protein YibQ
MEKEKVTIIVEEEGPDKFKVRRVKNYTVPIMAGLVTGIVVSRETLEHLKEGGADIIIDMPGYKRRWTP